MLTTPPEGIPATVNETMNVARTAPPMLVAGRGTEKSQARKTIPAP